MHNHGPLFPLEIITDQKTVFSPTILLNHSTYTLQYYQIIHSIYKIIPSISFTCNNVNSLVFFLICVSCSSLRLSFDVYHILFLYLVSLIVHIFEMSEEKSFVLHLEARMFMITFLFGVIYVDVWNGVQKIKISTVHFLWMISYCICNHHAIKRTQ